MGDLTPQDIENITRWAQQPRAQVWRKWLALLRPHVPPSDRLLEYKPSLVMLCEPLLGRMVADPKTGERRNQLPSLRERIAIFREALAIAEAFCEKNDLAIIAGCRRQVANFANVPEIDIPLYALIEKDECLSAGEIYSLSERMPPKSWIRLSLQALALGKVFPKNEEAPLLLAAE